MARPATTGTPAHRTTRAQTGRAQEPQDCVRRPIRARPHHATLRTASASPRIDPMEPRATTGTRVLRTTRASTDRAQGLPSHAPIPVNARALPAILRPASAKRPTIPTALHATTDSFARSMNVAEETAFKDREIAPTRCHAPGSAMRMRTVANSRPGAHPFRASKAALSPP